LVTDREGDCGYQNSNWKENEEPGERFGNSDFGEKATAAAAGGRDAIATERRATAGGNGFKECLEGTQAQDLGLDWNLDGDRGVGGNERRGGDSRAEGFS